MRQGTPREGSFASSLMNNSGRADRNQPPLMRWPSRSTLRRPGATANGLGGRKTGRRYLTDKPGKHPTLI